MSKIPLYPSSVAPNEDDLLVIEDSVTANTKKIKRSDLLGGNTITATNDLATDAITGITDADSGTIFGVGVANGKIDGSSIINIYGKHITIVKNATQNITQNTQAIIQFNAAVAGYDATLFELNTYGIKILSNKIKSVMVTLNTQLAAAHSFILYIFNGSTLQCALKIATNESGQLAGIVINVAQNDIISGRIYDLTANGQITAAGDWNFMTATVLETV